MGQLGQDAGNAPETNLGTHPQRALAVESLAQSLRSSRYAAGLIQLGTQTFVLLDEP
jgi:hypothetical protein